jgi:hypothetical protein
VLQAESDYLKYRGKCKELSEAAVRVNPSLTKGEGTYISFDGMIQCSECGKDMKEEKASYESSYCFCSYECYGRFVGVFP